MYISRQFTEEETRMVKKHVKWEMQIQTFSDTTLHLLQWQILKSLNIPNVNVGKWC